MAECQRPRNNNISLPWGAELPYGTVGLIDVVRLDLLPNTKPGVTYQVATSGYFDMYVSASSEGDKWKGYRIVSGWFHQTYPDLSHKTVAFDERIRAALRSAIEDSVKAELTSQGIATGN